MSEAATICVYCGGRSGNSNSYLEEAGKLGNALAEHNYRLVYGGGGNGMMGTISNAVMNGGGEVIGVIPHFLRAWEAANENVTRLIYTDTMHERKKTMFDYADAFIFMPGGLGTLDELFETLAWNSLKLHNKPMVLLNVENYWVSLLDLLNHVKTSQFLHGKLTSLESAASVADAMHIIKQRLSDG